MAVDYEHVSAAGDVEKKSVEGFLGTEEGAVLVFGEGGNRVGDLASDGIRNVAQRGDALLVKSLVCFRNLLLVDDRNATPSCHHQNLAVFLPVFNSAYPRCRG